MRFQQKQNISAKATLGTSCRCRAREGFMILQNFLCLASAIFCRFFGALVKWSPPFHNTKEGTSDRSVSSMFFIIFPCKIVFLLGRRPVSSKRIFRGFGSGFPPKKSELRLVSPQKSNNFPAFFFWLVCDLLFDGPSFQGCCVSNTLLFWKLTKVSHTIRPQTALG